jgi:hypothetical protein
VFVSNLTSATAITHTRSQIKVLSIPFVFRSSSLHLRSDMPVIINIPVKINKPSSKSSYNNNFIKTRGMLETFYNDNGNINNFNSNFEKKYGNDYEEDIEENDEYQEEEEE